MNKIYTLLIFALLLSMSTADAQVASLKAYQKAGKKSMEIKDYYSAMQYYKLALKKDSTRIYNVYNLAEAARLYKSFNVAIAAYRKVLTNKTDDFPLTEFWLAKSFYQQAEYDSAMVYYQRFSSPPLTSKGLNNETDTKVDSCKTVAKLSIEDCKWAIKEKQSAGAGYNIFPFGNGVNTAAAEFAPLEHQQQIYYSGLEYDTENFCPNPNSGITRMYTSTDVNGGVPSAINWAKEEKGQYITHTTFSNRNTIDSTYSQGDTINSFMYFTECKRINASEFECQIYQRKKDEYGLWGKPYLLPKYINSPGSNNTQPNIGYDESEDTEYLFFASNRADSVGGAIGDYDIYCSIVEKNGQVGKPVKLSINTEEDDITPFFNNETLYFSSKGYQGFGGFDIFKSQKYGSDWAPAESMGYYLNSSYDDTYFTTDEKFENAYFASNRLGVVAGSKETETCCPDIFKLEMIRVDLNVYTFNEEAERLYGEGEKITFLNSCYVTLFDIATGEQIERKFNPDSNYFYFPLEINKEYQVTGTHEGRWTDTLSYVSTKGIKETTTLTTTLDLNPEVELYAYTFDSLTREPLYGCHFEFFSKETGQLIFETDRIDDNSFYRNRLLTEFGNEYIVVASKEGYSPDSVYFSTKGLYLPSTLRDSIYLFRGPGDFNFTLNLYFYNDEPNKDTWSTTSTINYEKSYDLYNVYLPNELEIDTVRNFMEEYSKGLGNQVGTEEDLRAQEVMKDWFLDESDEAIDGVALGMRNLRKLANRLDEILTKDNLFRVRVEGSASPRAKSRYNANLSKRRTNSVQKYLATYPSLAQAIEEGRLQLIMIDRGEEPSKGKGIEDAYEDPMSIYGLRASKERKVKLYEFNFLEYPLSIYFDLNQPSSSTQSYQQLYNVLTNTSRKNYFIAENQKDPTEEDKRVREFDVKNFYDGEISDGILNLEMVAFYLNKNLAKGKKFQIDIETSGDLAPNKVKSIENYLRNYTEKVNNRNVRVLSRYIRNGSLRLNLIQVEEKSFDLGKGPVIDGFEQRKAKILRIKEVY